MKKIILNIIIWFLVFFWFFLTNQNVNANELSLWSFKNTPIYWNITETDFLIFSLDCQFDDYNFTHGSACFKDKENNKVFSKNFGYQVLYNKRVFEKTFFKLENWNFLIVLSAENKNSWTAWKFVFYYADFQNLKIYKQEIISPNYTIIIIEIIHFQ